MSLFRLSNHIFELGLDAQEMSVYAYLCSLTADTRTITGKEIVKVKQRRKALIITLIILAVMALCSASFCSLNILHGSDSKNMLQTRKICAIMVS